MIEFNNVSFSYDNKNQIFNDLNVKFDSSGLYVILGSSGSGKSTFLSLLTKTLKPTKGTISFSNRYSYSIVFQNSLLLDYLTVVENITLPLLLDGYSLSKAKKIAVRELEKLSILNIKDKYPNSLSGGEKSRVAIARSLLKKNNCLILDEPTGQLDENNSLIIYDILKKLSKEMLIILVTHDEKNAYTIADYLYEIKNKKLELIFHSENQSINNCKKQKKDGNIKIYEALKLFFLFFKSKKKRVIISTLFSSFALSFLYLGINIKNNLNTMLEKVTDKYYSTDVYSIKSKEEIKNDKKITLNKYSIPSLKILNSLYIKDTYYSLNYFLPEYYSLNLNKIEKTIIFSPIFKKDNKHKKFNIIVNSKFKEDFNLKTDEISFKRNVILQSKNYKNNELVDLSIKFKIDNIIDEISLFNQPTIYYNYFDILDYFSTIKLSEFDNINLKELLLDEKNNDEDFKSQELYFVSNNINEILNYKREKKLENVIIKNKSLEFKESFKDIYSSMEAIFKLFLLFCLVNSFILEVLSISSLYEENIRLFALSKVYSSNNKNNYLLIFSLGLLLFFIVSILTFLLSFIFRSIINKLLLNLKLVYLHIKFDFVSILIVSTIIFLVSIICSFISKKRISQSKIKNELIAQD